MVPKASQSTVDLGPCSLLSQNNGFAKLLFSGLTVPDSLVVTSATALDISSDLLKVSGFLRLSIQGSVRYPGSKEPGVFKIKF